MTLHWRLVPGKADDRMLHRADSVTDLVDAATSGMSSDQAKQSRLKEIGLAYEEMLSAVPPLTAAQVDEMCRAMWPERWWWQIPWNDGRESNDAKAGQAADRTRMRRFLTTAFGATFEEEK